MSIINYIHNLDLDQLAAELETGDTRREEIEEIRSKAEDIKVACKRALIKQYKEKGEFQL